MADLVRQAREDLVRVGLLGDASTEGVVPDLIVRSWRRSLSSSVDSAALCQRYSDIDTDSILRRAADPVLDRWQNHLTDTGATLFLSDRAGSIVARRTSDSAARRRLDSVHAAEGFDYSEDSVGTNGLGTSMVEGRALLIAGSQHYNDALAGLACTAAPVYTPTGAARRGRRRTPSRCRRPRNEYRAWSSASSTASIRTAGTRCHRPHCNPSFSTAGPATSPNSSTPSPRW